MTRNKLQLAPQKSEAIFITGRKKTRGIQVKLGGEEIVIKDKLRYLGVIIDKELSFIPHLDHVTAKTEKTVAALSRLVPNLGGPGENKRKMLQLAADSVLLYAAPVWADILKYKKYRDKLLSRQRKFALRVSCAFRTVSVDAAAVIARVLPIDLLLEERKAVFGKTDDEKARERESLLAKWQLRWRESEKGKWTKTLIPEIKPWLERTHGEVDYHLTQVLSGHGCFQQYVHKIGKVALPTCLFCEGLDDAEHTLFICPRWIREREETSILLREQINKDNLVQVMLKSNYNWGKVKEMVKSIMKTKEETERRLRSEALGSLGQ